MNMKYYMRGLGVGIILTTVILSFGSRAEKLTDQEIIARAKQLGMVTKEEKKEKLDSFLAQINADKDNNQVDTKDIDSPSINDSEVAIEESKENIKDNTKESIEDNTKENIKDQNQSIDETNENNKEENEHKSAEETIEPDMVTISIKRGMSSNKVAEVLYENGLIHDANDFVDYIIAIRKEGQLRVGNYDINKGSSYKEIVAKITR